MRAREKPYGRGASRPCPRGSGPVLGDRGLDLGASRMCVRGRLPTVRERRGAARASQAKRRGGMTMLRKISMTLVTLAVAALTVVAVTASGATRANGALQWTMNGTPIGVPVPAPPEANDFHAFWKPRG